MCFSNFYYDRKVFEKDTTGSSFNDEVLNIMYWFGANGLA